MLNDLAPYLNFNGDGAAALALYQAALGGEVTEKMTYRDLPHEVAPEVADYILHSRLQVGGKSLYLCDTSPDRPVQQGDANWVMMDFASVDDIERVFAALAEGGEVTMPLADTFWEARYGQLTDRFGVRWMLNCQLNTNG